MKLAVTLALAGAASAGFAPEYMQAGMFDADFEGTQFSTEGGVMQLHLMMDKVGEGAVCLDGTPAGFYFRPAVNATNANDWVIFFQGGGWCYDEQDCFFRSTGGLGSSVSWRPSMTAGGLLSPDCNVNPDFCNFNLVLLAYCDGNSFSGNRDQPILVNGKNLYFRGRRILDATLQTLEQMGLNKAENVLVSGCSAGGLSTYLHADYVADHVRSVSPSVRRVKAAPVSGFFLDHPNIAGTEVYRREMQNIWALANSTGGVNSACVQNQLPGDEWKCNFAPHTYPHVKTPIIVLNSALDGWQTGCILTAILPSNFPYQDNNDNGFCSGFPEYAKCQSNPAENCTSQQIEVMNQFINDFGVAISSSPTYKGPGNAAFIHSCHTHCEAMGTAYNTFTVNGVTIQQAVSKWWKSDPSSPAVNYSPCTYKTGEQSGSRSCNPTCKE